MSFQLRGPQNAVHTSGFRVFVADRTRVGYEDSEVNAEVEVEFGSRVTLYEGSLKFTRGRQSGRLAAEVIERIEQGLAAMGADVEILP